MTRIFFQVCSTVVAGNCAAQNNTSPYSMLGLGDIEKSFFDRSSGMGHSGTALSSNRFMYNGNPASYSSLDEHFFYMELSTRFKAVNYSGTPITDLSQTQSSDMQFKRMSVAVKPRPRWTIAAGLMPFSTVNYSFYATKSVQGSAFTSTAYYNGTGSTNQFYVTNSFAVSRNLSVGIQAGYLFGQTLETETFPETVGDSVLTTNRNIFIGTPYLKLGLQYRAKLNRDWDLSAGATFSNKTQINAGYHLLVQDGTTILADKEYTRENYTTIPVMYAAGLAASYKNEYTLAIDYHYQAWSRLNQKGLSYAMVNSDRISGGIEYAPKIRLANNQLFEKYFLQSGFFYNNAYLKIYGQQLHDYGFTFATGTQLRPSGLGVQATLEAGSRGTRDHGLIKEKYTQFNITISYRDLWIPRKLRKYD